MCLRLCMCLRPLSRSAVNYISGIRRRTVYALARQLTGKPGRVRRREERSPRAVGICHDDGADGQPKDGRAFYERSS